MLQYNHKNSLNINYYNEMAKVQIATAELMYGIIKEKVKEEENIEIEDLCCGTAFVLRLLLFDFHNKIKYTGFDKEKKCIDFCNDYFQEYRNKAYFKILDITQFELQKIRQNVVMISNFALQWIENKEYFFNLSRCYSSFIFSTPLYHNQEPFQELLMDFPREEYITNSIQKANPNRNIKCQIFYFTERHESLKSLLKHFKNIGAYYKKDDITISKIKKYITEFDKPIEMEYKIGIYYFGF